MSIPEKKIKQTKVKVAVKVMTSVALRVLEKRNNSSEQFNNKVVTSGIYPLFYLFFMSNIVGVNTLR